MLSKAKLLDIVIEAIITIKPGTRETPIDTDTAFFATEQPVEDRADLGFDSLDALDLLAILEPQLTVNLDEPDFSKVATVGDLIDIILNSVESVEV